MEAYTHVDLHLAVQSIVQQQVVGHAYAMRLHRMSLAIVIVANVTCARNKAYVLEYDAGCATSVRTKHTHTQNTHKGGASDKQKPTTTSSATTTQTGARFISKMVSDFLCR